MKKIILVMALFSVLVNCFSQEKEKGYKVGLVLSGGGAKGLAHIGVLKALEDAGVEISYIGGTSMGAIIGGLYASGYSAREIDSIFKVTDFENIIQDNLPRTVKSFYEKENDDKYAITLPFNKFKIGIPIAFSKGQNTYNLLNRLTYRVHHINDFNQLPIPFLCVATDIENGQAVILNKGYLPQAMKASGAFPSLFSPVEIDGRFLIDGGVVNNYPLKEVRALGADIIIGVDVQDNLMNRERMSSAASVVMQIVNFQMYQGMEEKAKETDIYIKPNIKGFNVISFDAGNQIIKNGEEAANVFKEELVALAAKQKQTSKIKIPFNFSRIDTICINKVEIKGNKNYSNAYILGKMRFKSHQTMAFDRLDAGLSSLNATQNFKKIDYQLKATDEGDDLVLDLKESDIKSYLRFGVHYDGLYKSAALINYTKKNLLFKNDVASIDFMLGDNLRYNLDYYVDNGFYWSFGFKSRYNRFDANVAIPKDDEEIASQIGINKFNIKYTDITNQVYLQTLFRQVFSVGAGIEHKYIKMDSETINGLFLQRENYYGIYGYIKYDTYDNKYFPRNGEYFNGDFKWVLLSSDDNIDEVSKFSISEARMGIARTYLKKVTFRAQAEGGFSIGRIPQAQYFLLGGYGFNEINGFKPFFGYDFLALYGDTYIKGMVGVDYEIFRKNHINFYANYANIGEQLLNDFNLFSKPTFSGYAIGYGLETLIGPVEVKHSWSPETRKHYWSFNVGFQF
ncbi:patatin-like phospholipase family protein [Flavobacterium sp. '19STA2R22 D10 B1']|uniref:patatin-like phospholipase family protein n=1 Tax=Flavobacterium aerium TaxID=3037261 RepID=UPI00278BD760|nr:patatin-like phospholipase family protein [Flavobacterium sp. '19STA2R22 D10 B1']